VIQILSMATPKNVNSSNSDTKKWYGSEQKDDYDPSKFYAHAYIKDLKMRKSYDSKNLDLEHFLQKTAKTPFMPINIKKSRKGSTS
jgi:hypothetical protein